MFKGERFPRFLLAAALIFGPSDTIHPQSVQSPVFPEQTQTEDQGQFTPCSSFSELLTESEIQGKPFFPFAIESPDDVDVSIVEDAILITAKNPITYLSNTEGTLYAGIYGQKVTVPRHIDLSVQAGLFTVEEIDAEKKTKISTQFYSHGSDFNPLWTVGRSKQEFKRGKPLFKFSGSQVSQYAPEDTLIIRISRNGITQGLESFASKKGKILYCPKT